MKKLRPIVCAMLLMMAVGLSLGTQGSGGPLLVKVAIAAQECVKCTDVGCVGGNVLCAQFECKGVLVQCFTTAPPHLKNHQHHHTWYD